MVIIGTPLKPVASSCSKEAGSGFQILWINRQLKGMTEIHAKSSDCRHEMGSCNELHEVACKCTLLCKVAWLPRVALSSLKFPLSRSAVVLNRLFVDGRMCVVRLRVAPVSVQRRSLLACGSTVVLLCEAWGGLTR